MGRTHRATAVLLLAVALMAATAAVQAKPPPPPPPKAFSIAGDVTGLYPGSQRTLRLTVTNTVNATVYVHLIAVDSVSVNRAGCPAASVWSPGFAGSLRLAKRGKASVSVQVLMKSTAPKACQGATYTIRYTGVGERS